MNYKLHDECCMQRGNHPGCCRRSFPCWTLVLSSRLWLAVAKSFPARCFTVHVEWCMHTQVRTHAHRPQTTNSTWTRGPQRFPAARLVRVRMTVARCMPLVACCSDVGAGGDEQLDHAHVASICRTHERRPPAAQQPASTSECIALFGARPYPEASSALTSAEAVTSMSMTRKWLVSAAC